MFGGDNNGRRLKSVEVLDVKSGNWSLGGNWSDVLTYLSTIFRQGPIGPSRSSESPDGPSFVCNMYVVDIFLLAGSEMKVGRLAHASVLIPKKWFPQF